MEIGSKYYKFDIISKTNFVKFANILYLVLHISIIIIFEILFYFLYIIKKEYEVFDYILNDIDNYNYNNLNHTTKYIINEFLSNINELNNINNIALIDKNNRINTKNILFKKSLIIIFFFGILSILIISFGVIKKKIKIKYLIIDLFAILFMISIFEYIFFSCIVSNIRPISPYELLNNIINNLQNYIEN